MIPVITTIPDLISKLKEIFKESKDWVILSADEAGYLGWTIFRKNESGGEDSYFIQVPLGRVSEDVASLEPGVQAAFKALLVGSRGHLAVYLKELALASV